MARLVRGSFFPLLLVPVAAAFAYTAAYGVNLVFWDEWIVVSLVADDQAGSLSLADLFAQRNGHRLLFPLLALVSLARLTDLNTIAEMYVSQTALVATSVALLLAARRTLGPRHVLLIVLAFLAFSLRQSGNMLWGFAVATVFASCFSVVSLFLLHTGLRSRRAAPAFGGALAAATVASFSAFQGLLVWPAGLVQLLLIRRGRAHRVLLGAWVATAVVIHVVYFQGYGRPRDQLGQSPWEPLTHPLATARFFLTLAGGSLFGRPALALASGVLLVALAALALTLAVRRRELREVAFWVSLVVFVLLVLASITAGRSHLGIDFALPSRYASFSLLLVAALLVLLAHLWRATGSRVSLVSAGLLVLLVAVSVARAYQVGITEGRRTSARFERLADVLSTYRSQPDARLRQLHPSARLVRRLAPELERRRLNVFAADSSEG